MSIEIQVVDDPAQVCADALSVAAASGEHLVLTGGSSPRHAYELAATQNPRSWHGAQLWFTDERCVAPDDRLSNFRMVKESLIEPLDRAGAEVEFCRRILGERGPQEAALEYERELEHVGGGPGAIRFELVLLGVGPDGHICSMFPGQDSLSERARFAVGVPEAGLEPFVPRVTLTFAALGHAKRVLILATGASKADAIAGAFADDAPRTPAVPASLLVEHVEDIVVLLDEAAAARL
ncbi:MAG: 6-phosphogluconolactonase [Acidobacteriota bacterium]|nr:6-phosphogluconolactonase [Acidobacteriota bacterium]